MADSPRYVEVKCPKCFWVHASVPLSTVLSEADSPQQLARYFRCFNCSSPTSSFVPARPEDAPTGCTLQVVVVGSRWDESIERPSGSAEAAAPESHP
jgi:hypothetical protein